MAKCQAITSRKWTHQIEWIARCQNRGDLDAHGVKLCGTHINQLKRGPIDVVRELDVEDI